MIRQASAKRKADSPACSGTKRTADSPSSTADKKKQPLKQSTLALGGKGLVEQPANSSRSAAAGAESQIVWHFCDPTPATPAPKRSDAKGSDKSSGTDKQVSALLKLMNRGKARRKSSSVGDGQGRSVRAKQAFTPLRVLPIAFNTDRRATGCTP